MYPTPATKTEPPREWFADESFWEATYPEMFAPQKFTDAIEQVQKIIQLTNTAPGPVLDLCCGPGRHSIAFAHAGFHVTGVDSTRYLLDKAIARAREENITIEWIEQDMRHFIREGAFTLAVNLFTAFGYFDDKSEDLKVLENIFASLRPGGHFVLDVLGKEQLASRFQASDCEIQPDGTVLAVKREIFDDWTRIRNEHIIIRDGVVKRYKLHHTIYSAQELRDRFTQVGFQNIRIFGDLDANPYAPTAKRLILIGQKP